LATESSFAWFNLRAHAGATVGNPKSLNQVLFEKGINRNYFQVPIGVDLLLVPPTLPFIVGTRYNYYGGQLNSIEGGNSRFLEYRMSGLSYVLGFRPADSKGKFLGSMSTYGYSVSPKFTLRTNEGTTVYSKASVLQRSIGFDAGQISENRGLFGVELGYQELVIDKPKTSSDVEGGFDIRFFGPYILFYIGMKLG
jgi:hypothetical protein